MSANMQRKSLIVICSAILVIVVLTVAFINRHKSEPIVTNHATGQTDDYVGSDLKAYLMEEEIELVNDLKQEYKLNITINDIPKDESIYGIYANLTVPSELEVVDVVINEENLEVGEIEFNEKEEGYEIRIYNADGSPIRFNNYGLDKELITLILRLKESLSKSITKEVSIEAMGLESSDNKKIDYDVAGAKLNVNYTAPAKAIGKRPPNANPLISHKFGADPWALVYDGRVYVYTTHDILEYDAKGNIVDNTYAKINTISLISSDDLRNWTDHGEIKVAGPEGAAKWASQSWAPAVSHKVIDGKDKFFLYFSNNASGIGVLESDSPVGPWRDPIGKPLISRSTPGVEGVVWLFDPATLVDDDGKAYIYFGGGIPEGQEALPNTGRVMQLGDDMISVVGEAAVMPAPFMFESSGINKINGMYYYSYCSNFFSGQRPEGSPAAGVIAYMTSSSPFGPWEYRGTILRNPGEFFGVGGNNHHAIFQFQGNWYIVYHAQTVAKDMGVPKGYRSPHINQVVINADGTIEEVIADYEGVAQLKPFNPYEEVQAETFAWSAGVSTKAISDEAPWQRALTDIDNGDWIAISQVDFGEKGPSSFTARVSNVNAHSVIELRLDAVDGKLIGVVDIPVNDEKQNWVDVTAKVSEVKGVHDLYMIFKGKADTKLFDFDCWQFR